MGVLDEAGNLTRQPGYPGFQHPSPLRQLLAKLLQPAPHRAFRRIRKRQFRELTTVKAVPHDPFNLRGYVVLVGQQVGRQAGETLLTLGAEEAAGLVRMFLGFSSSLVGSQALAWAAAIPLNFAATPGALAEDVCFRCILCRCYWVC